MMEIVFAGQQKIIDQSKLTIHNKPDKIHRCLEEANVFGTQKATEQQQSTLNKPQKNEDKLQESVPRE